MSSYYDEDTQWIKDHAGLLSDLHGVHYHSVLYAGLDAYQAGMDPDGIKKQMNKAIRWNHIPPVSAITIGETG